MASRHGRRRRRGHDEGHVDERWLVSYSDMMTVLFALFLVLYSMSSVNISKYHALRNTVAEALGTDPAGKLDPTGEDPEPEVIEPITTDPNTQEDPVEDLIRRLRQEVKNAGLGDVVTVTREPRGVIIRFSDKVLFDYGSADLLPSGKKVLNRLEPVLDDHEHPMVIEGHTDNHPINTPRFPSNWELSTHRATNVLHYLDKAGLDANRLSAAGYADTRPRESNATDKGRAANRRVELVVQVPPAPAGAGG
jgi:chemotaxis protein MotB